MTRSRVIAVGAFLLLSACASSGLERQFSSGQYLEVVGRFEADSTLHGREDALYFAALSYAQPGSAAYDPDRAFETLERLLSLHPHGRRQADAAHLHGVLAETARLTRDQASREDQLAAVRAELEYARARAATLEEALADQTTRASGLQTIADRLARDIQGRDARIRALEEELEALKEIDLNRTPP